MRTLGRFLLLSLAAGLLAAPGGRAAPARRPQFPELEQGEQLMRSRAWDDAEEWFYRFVKKHPQHAEALRRLAVAELRRPGGDAVRARQYLERAERIEPDDPVGQILLAKVEGILGDTEAAARRLDRLIERGPGRDEPVRASAVHLARFLRALLHESAGRLDEAESLLREVVRREAAHAYAWYELGRIALERGDTEAAVEQLRKAVDDLDRWAPVEAWLYPGGRYTYVRENSRYELARALLSAGRAQEALELLAPLAEEVEQRSKRRQRPATAPKAPVEGKPDLRFENAPYFRGEALAALGRKKDAVKAFKAFARMRVGDPKLRQRAKQRAKELR